MVTNEKRQNTQSLVLQKNIEILKGMDPESQTPPCQCIPTFLSMSQSYASVVTRFVLAPLNLSVLLIITPLSNLKTSLDIHQIKDNSDLDVEKTCQNYC